MKAITYSQYGPPEVLQFSDIDRPVPGKNEILVKVHAASVNAADWRLMRASPFIARLSSGLLKPKDPVLGADIAGTVVELGGNISQFRIGDEVYADTAHCGRGGFAEYVTVREDLLAPKPARLNFEQAAAVPLAGMTALHGLRDTGKIKAGQAVLIHGAGGGVGTFAVQIAKSFDTEVTAVCSSGNLDLVRELGADHAIDYTQESFTTRSERYDLIVSVNGYHTIFDYRRALKPEGRHVMVGGDMKQVWSAMFLGPWLSMFSRKKSGISSMKATGKDLAYLTKLIDEGKVKPIIDRRFSLSEVPDAVRYLEAGHARGKVVIVVDQS